MATSVSGATKYFPKPQEGFSTTTSGSVSSGGTSVGLSSTGNYSNGDVVVLIIEPGVAGKEQSFTGTIDTGGSQVTGVVWTSGTNSAHSGGVTVVDYVAAAHLHLISTGLLVEHDQDGTHGNITGGTANFTGAVTTDIVSEKTAANGVTIDGLNIKDGALNTANSVNAAALDGIDKSLLSTDSNPYKFSAYRNTALSPANGTVLPFDTELFDTNNNFDIVTNKGRYTAPVNGFYFFTASILYNISGNAGTAYGQQFYKNGSLVQYGSNQVNMYNGAFGVSSPSTIFMQLTAGDYIEVVTDTNGVAITTGAANTYFSGFLVSRT